VRVDRLIKQIKILENSGLHHVEPPEDLQLHLIWADQSPEAALTPSQLEDNRRFREWLKKNPAIAKDMVLVWCEEA
jgi:hypothetical protein